MKFLAVSKLVWPWCLRVYVDLTTPCLAAIFVYENCSPSSRFSIFSIAAWIGSILMELSRVEGKGVWRVLVFPAHHAHGHVRTHESIQPRLPSASSIKLAKPIKPAPFPSLFHRKLTMRVAWLAELDGIKPACLLTSVSSTPSPRLVPTSCDFLYTYLWIYWSHPLAQGDKKRRTLLRLDLSQSVRVFLSPWC